MIISNLGRTIVKNIWTANNKAITCRNWGQKFRFQSTSTKDSPASINEGPLHGIRVLDLTRILAGPYCTMLLGDLGAEVLKVEKLGNGDDTRLWTPPSINNQSCYFVSVNRNKKSIALDLKKGQDIIHQLVQKCDILVENFLPGQMDKLGMGYKVLKELNPRLIYCAITGYGSDGPYVARGGYDVIASSLGGLLHITGLRDGDPCKVGVAMTDLATGLYAHGAIMAALIHRNATGEGQRIDCNLLSTQMACLVNLASNYLNAGVQAQRWGTAHESIVPYQSFQTKDKRWITIGAGNNEHFSQFCDKIELPYLKDEEKFSTNSLRVDNRVELIDLISKVMITKGCDEWMECFKGVKFPYGPVNDIKDAFNDPQVIHNEMVHTLGEYKVVGPAVTFSAGGNFPRYPPPTLGQNTRDILRDVLECSETQIEKLYASKIVE